MLNHITLMGRLTRDPELRRTQQGTPVTSFTVAVGRDINREQTDFIDVVAWNGAAEFVTQRFKKGELIVVAGRLQIRDWTDRDGGKRRNAEIIAQNVYFGEGRRSSSEGGFPITRQEEPQGARQDFSEMDDDDGDLPF